MDMSQMNPYTTPSGKPPPGEIPNFVDPYSRSHAAVAVCSVLLALTVPCVVARLVVRLRVSRNAGLDDWVGLAGAILTIAFTIYAIYVFTIPGNGPHIWNIPLIVFVDPHSDYFLKMMFTQLLYPICACVIKLSLFLLYARLFITPSKPKMKWWIYGGAIFTVTIYIILIIMYISYCAPDPSLLNPQNNCVAKGGQVSWALSSINISSDLYALTIPAVVISKLNMTTRKKVAVGGIFFLGSVATIASIMALYYRVVMSSGTDVSWYMVPSGIFTLLEVNLGVICSCLPALNVLIQKQVAKSRAATGTARSGVLGFMSRRSKRHEYADMTNSDEAKSWGDDWRGHGGIRYDRSVKLESFEQQTIDLGSRRNHREAYEI